MDFDKVIDRKSTTSRKWDAIDTVFGSSNLLPMWIADMDFESPKEVVEAIRRRAEHGVFGYPFHSESYFEAILDWHQRRHGFTIDRDWIICTPAVVTAISVAVQTFTNPGDKIIIQPPIYPPFFTCVTKNSRQIVENPLAVNNGQYEIDFDDLERKISPQVKMLIFCNPHNPIGRSWKKEDLRKLGEICVKNNIIILSDEMHCDLVFAPHKHTPLATISPEIAKQTVTFVSPAKPFNLTAFYNSVTVIADQTLRQRFYQALDNLELLQGNLFGIVALEAAYTYGEKWLDNLLLYLDGNAHYLTHFISENIPQIKLTKPEATYLAWLDCRDLNIKSEKLKQFWINQAKVAVNDGAAFGKQGEGFVRLNFGCPRRVLEDGLCRIKTAVDGLL